MYSKIGCHSTTKEVIASKKKKRNKNDWAYMKDSVYVEGQIGDVGFET